MSHRQPLVLPPQALTPAVPRAGAAGVPAPRLRLFAPVLTLSLTSSLAALCLTLRHRSQPLSATFS